VSSTRASVIVVDGFYRDPEAVRAYALGRRWYHPYQADAEVRSGASPAKWLSTWFADAGACPFKSSQRLVERLEALTGDVVDRDHWSRSFPLDAEGKAAADCERHERSCLWNCSFHVKPETEQRLGDGIHNHVTDVWNSVGPDGWAGLVYLTPEAPLGAGLKLWRNRDRSRDYDWMTPGEHWELVDDLGNVFNRLILARGSLPHSGARGWGSGVEDGRLFQTFFFRVLPREPLAPLELALGEASVPMPTAGA
jgi:hypothetical protein